MMLPADSFCRPRVTHHHHVSSSDCSFILARPRRRCSLSLTDSRDCSFTLARPRRRANRVMSCALKPRFDPLTGSNSLFIPKFLQDTTSLFKEAAQARQLIWDDSKRIETIYQNYLDAENMVVLDHHVIVVPPMVYQSGNPSAPYLVLINSAGAFDLMLKDLRDPFEFSSYHKAIRAPFDYYDFGQRFFRSLIDFKNSYVGNISIFQEIEEKLRKGENVILMSNNQGEADPVFIALLLESTYPFISENMTYVINWSVFDNPFYNIFNKGRNLIQYHVPEAVEKGANERINIDDIVSLLQCGSQIIWFAPSGRMDCLDPLTQEMFPGQFDSSSVVMMRQLSERSGIPSHVYPLALLSTDRISPPVQLEKDVEKRILSFHGVGLSVGPIINFMHEAAAATFNHLKNEVETTTYTKTLYDSVSNQYMVLKSAIHEKQGLAASNHTVSLTQPFIS